MNRQIYKNREAFEIQNEELGCKLPYSENVKILNESVKIGAHTAPNRLCAQPMEGCDGTPTGEPDELTRRRYLRFADGGVGIIWFEATACLEEGRANPRQLWMREGNLDSFKYLLDEIRETSVKANGYAPLIIMQDTHSGRYSKPHGIPAPLIAYNNPIFEGSNPISSDRILSDDDLDRIGEALIKNSRLAELAGFDGVDIKCCHRYLNSELLSAYNREGKYGTTLENRTRLLRESVAGAIDVTSSDFIVTSRLNVYDGFEYPYGFGVSKDGGLQFDKTEPVWLIGELKKIGVDMLDITMGNPYFNPHVNRPFSMGGYEPEEHPLTGVARMLHGTAELKRAVPDIMLMCSGVSYLGVVAPNVAAAFIENGDFDLCGFGRTTFAYPDFARDIINSGEMDKKKLCICCSKCTELMRSGSTPGCVIKDSLYTKLYKEMKEKTK